LITSRKVPELPSANEATSGSGVAPIGGPVTGSGGGTSDTEEEELILRSSLAAPTAASVASVALFECLLRGFRTLHRDAEPALEPRLIFG
jgi:hypothetical protein